MTPDSTRQTVKAGLLVVLVGLLAACTTNSLVIGYFYGRMDNRMEDRILEVARFDDAQKAEIKGSVDAFFAWHRNEELPKYAAWLLAIEQEVARGKTTTAAIELHFDEVQSFADKAFQRSPFANSSDFLKRLTDDQVTEIANYFEEQDKEFVEWLEERKQAGSKMERQEERVDALVKNVGRFGLNLGDTQRQIIADGLARLQTDPQARRMLRNRWQQTFLELLRQRQQVDFERRVAAHIAVYQDQNLIHRPQQVAHNRRISAEIIDDILASLDLRQRATLLDKLTQTRRSIIKVSSD